YKGLLHLAVGLYQLRRGRVVGAVAKLRSGCAYLAPFEPTCHGVDIAAVRASALRCLDAALALSPARVDAFDWSLAPRLPERP
ncbi:MAG: DUF309 domain-containing protein, partial [Dehalococcoidia bacterium]|nr:DUF309 domain-containing protein [Dehalococcoidia bacterium]